MSLYMIARIIIEPTEIYICSHLIVKYIILKHFVMSHIYNHLVEITRI